jgi:hypothetical protein
LTSPAVTIPIVDDEIQNRRLLEGLAVARQAAAATA